MHIPTFAIECRATMRIWKGLWTDTVKARRKRKSSGIQGKQTQEETATKQSSEAEDFQNKNRLSWIVSTVYREACKKEDKQREHSRQAI